MGLIRINVIFRHEIEGHEISCSYSVHSDETFETSLSRHAQDSLWCNMKLTDYVLLISLTNDRSFAQAEQMHPIFGVYFFFYSVDNFCLHSIRDVKNLKVSITCHIKFHFHKNYSGDFKVHFIHAFLNVRIIKIQVWKLKQKSAL